MSALIHKEEQFERFMLLEIELNVLLKLNWQWSTLGDTI